MAEIVFSMELKGSGATVEGKENFIHAENAGTGPKGEAVSFKSDVELTNDGFNETGTISYAGRGSLKFVTVGVGYLTQNPIAGLNYGAVVWNVTGGDGEFSGATGLITSNFSFSEDGKIVDDHYVRIFTP